MSRWYWTFGAVVVLVAGCSYKPSTSDPDKAAQLMTTALEAWKAGESPASLQGRSSPIVYVEPLWEDGAKLIKYEFDKAELKPDPYDIRCPVQLWIEKDGKEQGPLKVIYSIGTTPKQVIVRYSSG